MQTNFQSLFLTSFTAPELKFLIRQELETFFEKYKQINQAPEDDQLLNIKEAATLLSLSVPSMYRLCNEKKIPNLKKAGKILFSKQELMEWAKEGRRKTKTEIAEDAENHLASLGNKKKSLTVNHPIS